jgi:hypothetical protein
MRIHVRIPMPRKMFGYREYSAVFQPPGIGDNLIGNVHRIFTERAGVDNRILRIDVDIRHRSKIHLYTKFPALPCHFPTILIEQGIVLYTSQYHILRKDGCTPQTHGKSPLTVERNQQRNIRHALRFIRQHGLVLHQSAGKQQTADFIILDNLTQQLLIALVLIGGDCIDKKLSYPLFQAECAQNRIHPLPASHIIHCRPHQQRLHGGNNGRCSRTTFRIRSKTPATSHYNQYKQ